MVPQSQVELRHQIAAAIDAHLSVSVEPITADDIAAAAAYFERRKAVQIVAGEIVDGPQLPVDENFLDWVQAGGPLIPSAELPDFIIALVNRFNNPQPPNIK